MIFFCKKKDGKKILKEMKRGQWNLGHNLVIITIIFNSIQNFKNVEIKKHVFSLNQKHILFKSNISFFQIKKKTKGEVYRVVYRSD